MNCNYNISRIIVLSLSLIVGLLSWTDLAAAKGEEQAVNVQAAQQSVNVTGLVRDEEGEPLIGASVQLVGTSVGTITDVEGRFNISVPDANAKLAFSYIGFNSVTIELAGRTNLDVVMESNLSKIDEVVVVGYGTAKKRDLIGAVDQIDSEVLEGRPNPSITRSLQGQIPNLNITMSDGKPNRGATYNIRGETSIGAGGSALVLIDGVEGDPNTLNPQDVESVSVLKDASSAAVYGARGTFGVVLITTKNAKKGDVQVNYDGNVSFYTRTVKPSFVTNGYEWTTNFLEAFAGYNDYSSADPTSINNIFPFNREWYDELKRRNDNPDLPRVRVNNDGRYEYFGNTDWHNLLYKDWTQGTDHKISVRGGSDKATYYLSGRYFSQDGIYRYNSDDLERYNIRGKGSIEINPKLTVDNNFSIDNTDYHYPMMSYADELVQRNLEHQGFPVAMMFNPDGTYTYSAIYNGVGDFHNGTSYQDENTLNVRNTIGFTYKPLSILTFKGDYTYSNKDYQKTRVNRYAPYSEGPELFGEKGQSLRRMWNQETKYKATNLYGTLTPNLGKNHSLSALLGVNYEDSEQRRYYNRRDGYLYPDNPNFNLMDGENYVLEERSEDWVFFGAFFRANYAFKGKYLVEFSTRYDGSSKFPENEQWGIFPSVSAGWRISDENFMNGTRHWLDNLKLRFSAGTLGNGNVTPYSYTKFMGDVKKTSVLLDGSHQIKTEVPKIMPDNLTWEKSTTYDLGLDADMFNGRFNIVGDWYRRFTTDMYVNGPQVQQVLGDDSPKGNYAALKTEGWELSVGWRNRVNVGGSPLSYNVKLMVWDSQSWITEYVDNKNKILDGFHEGQRVGDIWGYTIDGLFTSVEEIANHADQSNIRVSKGRILLPGDLKFRDMNGDNVINNGSNRVGDSGDLSIIGNESERYRFGLNLGANYKGIGINAFFQGVGKRDWYPDIESGYFWGQYNRPYGYYPTDQVGNRWIDGVNEDPNAYWPRMRSYISNSTSKPMGVKNNRYLQNAAYVRLKSLTLDYTLPEGLVSKLNLSAVKIYVTGENLWTLTGLTKHTTNFDPEVIQSGDSDMANNKNRENGYSYPMLKSVTFGINVNF